MRPGTCNTGRIVGRGPRDLRKVELCTYAALSCIFTVFWGFSVHLKDWNAAEQLVWSFFPKQLFVLGPEIIWGFKH